MGIEYYGRYVDDFVIVHEDKDFLIDVQAKLRSFLQAKLMLRLHPRKIYLQHFSKGVKFIGAVVKPGREYIGNRTKGNLYAKIHYYNKEAEKNPRKAKKTAARPAGQRQFVSGVYDSLQNVQNPPPFARKGA